MQGFVLQGFLTYNRNEHMWGIMSFFLPSFCLVKLGLCQLTLCTSTGRGSPNLPSKPHSLDPETLRLLDVQGLAGGPAKHEMCFLKIVTFEA